MRISLFLFLLFVPFCLIVGQVVTSEPGIPIDSKPVKILFHADRGTAGLEGFSGDIYAHTGVITDKSTSGSDWKYVKTGWGENTPETKLKRLDVNLYELDIQPSIQAYYAVGGGESILKMAFVFRSADASLEGKDDGGADIFVDVFTDGFKMQINQPVDNSVLEKGETVTINISSTENADLVLYINEQPVAMVNDTELSYTTQLDETGNYWIIASADNGDKTIEDTLYVCVRKDVELKSLPQGLKKGINYLDDHTVGLVLWAPYKNHVFAIGDFSNWRPDNEFQMKKDGNYFWIILEGLQKGKPYVFQYLIDGELKIADPYTDQVSDPNYDDKISQNTYPDLVKYPYQKATGMAAVFQTGQNPFDWQVENFIPAEKSKLVIYELLIRDFDQRHSYSAVIDKLDYLKSLGINVLELMPVNEFEGNSSWGYNPSFYFAPDKYYGPKSELKRLIDECHKRGMAVFIDMVLNHSYGQSPFVQMYLEGGKPSVLNPWYNRESNFTNPDAQWGYDFNHESTNTQELVDSINSYWMSEYKVDGFRFDFTKGFGNKIKTANDPWGSIYDADRITLLKRMADEIWARNPNALVCFEHLSENREEKELADYGIMLWGNMNYNYAEAAMGYHDGNKSDLYWGIYSNRGWEKPNLITYMESHDEERIMYKLSQWGNGAGDYSTKDEITAAERIGLNALFFLPLPGPKMIWQFGELGYDISIDEGCRICEKPILWNYFEEWQRKNIYDIMSNLNYLKQNYDVFNGVIHQDLTKEIKIYRLEKDGQYVQVVGNFGTTEKSISLSFPVIGKWYDYFNNTSFEIEQNDVELTIRPGEYNLYSSQEMEHTGSITPKPIDEIKPVVEFQEFVVFPNPADFFLEWNYDLELVEIYRSNGQYLGTATAKELASKTITVDHLHAGSYVILGRDQDGEQYQSKFIKK